MPPRRRKRPSLSAVLAGMSSAEREMVLIQSQQERVVAHGSRADLKKFYELAGAKNLPKEQRDNIARNARRKAAPVVVALHGALEALRARARRVELPEPPLLVAPSEEFRAANAALLKSFAPKFFATLPVPEEVFPNSTVTAIFDRYVLYQGYVTEVKDGVCTVHFRDRDVATLPFEEVRVLEAGHRSLEVRRRNWERTTAPIGAGSTSVVKWAADAQSFAINNQSLAMRENDEDRSTEWVLGNLPVHKIHAILAAKQGPQALLDLKACVASDLRVEACAPLPDPRLDPALYDYFVWELGAGTGILSQRIVERGAKRGVRIGRIAVDIDPRRDATITQDVLELDYEELWRKCPPSYIHATGTCTSLAAPAWCYWKADATAEQKSRYAMLLALLQHYVKIAEYGHKLDPDLCFSFEFPRGKIEQEPVYGKMLLLCGGTLTAHPYSHCTFLHRLYQKSGLVLTNLPLEVGADQLTCDGNCPAVQIMKYYTGRAMHPEHVYYEKAAAAAKYPERFAVWLADAALVAICGARSSAPVVLETLAVPSGLGGGGATLALDDAVPGVATRPTPRFARDVPGRRADLANCSSTLVQTYDFFDMCDAGTKRVDYRSNTPYWRTRLLNKEPELAYVRLRGGYDDPGRVAVFRVLKVQEVAEKDVPQDIIPPRGSAAHANMFKGMSTLIGVFLGERLH